MDNSTGNAFICDRCKNEVQETDEFCPNCGGLFKDNVFCDNHHQQEAEGVCIICCLPYCEACGSWVNNLFLCANHEGYEIYQGMARVYGISDDAIAQYVRECLEQAGLHPFLYCRKASSISVGAANYTLFRASGEYDGHIINEIKVMVPCQEVVQAEQELKDLDVLK